MSPTKGYVKQRERRLDSDKVIGSGFHVDRKELRVKMKPHLL
jgi:hypothetical protein